MTNNETIVIKLIQAFPGSTINSEGEFIAHKRGNEWFNLVKCADENEVKCKVIEYFSRGAFKTAPFDTAAANANFQKFMRAGINAFLGTDFSEADMEAIYSPLGNNVNRPLCEEFIKSGYDMKVLCRGD